MKRLPIFFAADMCDGKEHKGRKSIGLGVAKSGVRIRTNLPICGGRQSGLTAFAVPLVFCIDIFLISDYTNT